ncbi:hypothetical protein NC652_004372 [Populus alba x Populus x berolinensis]|uniref:Uncharacterized protein n=2 Tax=Populus TaxID=3689 RepID=A0A4U5P4T3_POPAL|nr:hypothetical protein NC652_004372 [Populus alba x Populus x berolinensis]KAJ7015023.1 hypothetical protein NC653_004345 [Populus alba x Populus x berolinensis]TKR90681.1 hypothetical protein D5086_0000230860 [Populus alba]
MDYTNFAGNNGSCKSGSYHCHPVIPFPTPNKNWIKESSSRAKLVAIISGAIGLLPLFFIVGICWAMMRRQPAFIPREDATRHDVDYNILLYEYMPNGSLGDHLLGSVQTCSLDWNARYNIGLGAAERKRTTEVMSLVLKTALPATSTSPLNRPTMREVIAVMIDAREAAVNSPSESPQMKTLASEG